MDIFSQLRRVLSLLLPIGALFFMSHVYASTITVEEDEIVSLASAPEVLEINAAIDAAGRLVLAASLRFANACYAETGARVLAGRVAGGDAHAVILQRVNPEGCPEIFRPVEQRVAILLPSDLAGEGVRVIGKPAPPSVVRQQAFGRIQEFSLEASVLVEAQPFAPGAALPAFALAGLSSDASLGGYRLTGRVSLAEDCGAKAVEAQVFEVPDTSGTPVFDVVALMAPERCAVEGGETVADLGNSHVTAACGPLGLRRERGQPFGPASGLTASSAEEEKG